MKTYWKSTDALLEKLSALSNAVKQSEFLKSLTRQELEFLAYSWHLDARDNQRPSLDKWKTWLLLGGRGSGKTRTGAEYIKGLVLNTGLYPGDTAGRIALVGSSYADVRDVMIEGESGLLGIWGRRNRPDWVSSRRQLVWPCGTVATVLSAADPDQLRGHQFGFAWSDEACKWPYLEATWNMLQFCLRLGRDPRQIVTTTPKTVKLLGALLKDNSTVTSKSSTAENRANLAPGFVEFLQDKYGGTRLGRQELNGEMLEDREDALWNRALLDRLRVHEAPELKRIVIAVDPPATSRNSSAACGIIAVGQGPSDHCYVISDGSVEGATPSGWAKAAVGLYHKLNADVIVAETNQGGEMVRTVLQNVDPGVPVRMAHATRGKWLRAEPVALLYEQGKVHHVGGFGELEDQLCDFGPDGLSMGKSPDRLDALVWAISVLALQQNIQPRIRGV